MRTNREEKQSLTKRSTWLVTSILIDLYNIIFTIITKSKEKLQYFDRNTITNG